MLFLQLVFPAREPYIIHTIPQFIHILLFFDRGRTSLPRAMRLASLVWLINELAQQQPQSIDGIVDVKLAAFLYGSLKEVPGSSDEALSLLVVVEVARVVSGSEPALPGNGPYLEEVDGVLVVLVLLGMRDARAARGELDVAAMHAVELV